MPLFALALFGFVAASPAAAASPTPCESLARLALPHTRITRAQAVPAGEFAVDSLTGRLAERFMPPVIKDLPRFCRVTAEITPTTDSDIRIEVWLPVTGWNGKLVGLGNGGWSGFIVYPGLGAALRQGYAVAASNAGHDGSASDASFALGHPEKLVDFGYRAVHEMTVTARALVQAFYGSQVLRAYWDGCSTGGKQGLTEAQRFPLDYDAIIAGAPANNWTHLMAGDVWTGQATHATPASYIPRADYALIHNAALDACDADDGLKDGLIEKPGGCHFDPGVLLCRGDDHTGCLTGPQLEAARKIYAGARNARAGAQVYPGLEPGSELQWGVMAGSPEPPIVASYFKYLVFRDSSWDYRTLDFDADVARADSLDAAILNATDPHLERFLAHGGKLLLYHGWSDGLIAPENTANYYDSVVNAVGPERARDGVRLFMIPGMQHCGGGDGPNEFDALVALDGWVRTGKAPERIEAAQISGRKMVRTRPLCPYPQIAHFTGHGSPDDAANFVCRAGDAR